MNTIDLEEVKKEVLKKFGYTKPWVALSLDDKALLVDEISTEFAKQCCDELQKTDWIELQHDGSNQPDETGKYFVVIKGKSDIATYIEHYKGWIASSQYYSDDFRNIGITHYSIIQMPNTPNVVTTKP